MRVSIIIPCYNSATYLEACMASVLAQTMTDFEVILVDDGSTDRTLAIAQRIAEQDARVRVLSQKNSGVSAARNLGLDHSCGEWVTFVDSDDLIVPDMLETMLSAAEAGVDMVVCAHKTFTDAGSEEIVIPETRWMDLKGEAKKRAAALRLIEGDCVLNIMCNKLHRRALIEREGLRLDRSVRIAEDALFNLEAVLCGRGIAYVNKATYLYRMHAASATQSQTASEFDKHLPWLRAMREVLLKRKAMEAYYGAYLDSVALRLYKDGGVQGVMGGFRKKAVPLVVVDRLDTSRMTAAAWLLACIVKRGLYPIVYPAIYPVQVIRRKAREAAFYLRARKEMPDA
ncbi:MAG: glycosyltransferase [Clostridia bacterium]|nr:glycosyltransferase [Clostridia bacterium]